MEAEDTSMEAGLRPNKLQVYIPSWKLVEAFIQVDVSICKQLEAYMEVDPIPWKQMEAWMEVDFLGGCLLYTSPSPRDLSTSRMPSSA